MKQSTFFNSLSKPKLEETEKETIDALEFELSKTDPERSDVIYNGKKLGDVGTNLVGLINEYYGLYKEMEASIRKHHPKELDEKHSLEDLKGFVAKKDKSAVNVVLYQIGMKAFNGFIDVVKEPDTSKKFSKSKAVLKEAKHHIDLLLDATVFLNDHNVPNMQHFSKKLHSIAGELESYKPSGRIAKVPGLTQLVSALLNKESRIAKTVSSSFDAAIKEYGTGPARIITIPSLQATTKVKKQEAQELRKAEKTSGTTVKK